MTHRGPFQPLPFCDSVILSPNLRVICHHVWCAIEVPETYPEYCIYRESKCYEEVRTGRSSVCWQMSPGDGNGRWGASLLAWPSCWGCPVLARRASGRIGLRLGALLHPHFFVRVHVLPYMPPASSMRRTFSVLHRWTLAAV